ncbi:MAG: HAD hydrolase-like protein [Mariniblastus sp.]|nr:HAD hydrolase-like protein [Mariniblastus sp.]
MSSHKANAGLFFLANFLLMTDSLIGIGQSQENTHITNELLNGTVWVQTALEHDILCRQAYQLADIRLQQALEDERWTAAIEQTANFEKLPPAVILDVDETVLDNSPFQARLVSENVEFTTEKWITWCKESQAEAMPGATRFIKQVSQKNIALFFVTNRDASVKDATIANLSRALDMPVAPEQVLCKNEKPEWKSSKTARRKYIAQTHRIVLLLGDDFNDFTYIGKVSTRQRVKKGEPYSQYFGTKWIQLPNPLYGNWEKSIYGFNYSTLRDEKLKLKYELLETKQQEQNKTGRD